jgi:uncharacterized protein (TIGR03435 family)
MPDASDMDLLRDYDRQGSEEAFAALVQRHINLVYSVALRHVGIAAHAEEITQAVFVILARQAGSLRADIILEGWLHTTTRLTALRFMRGERRRHFREQEAYMQSTLHTSPDASAWNQLAPLLDEAISRLGKNDRDAVMLRFFKEKSLREVAAGLNVSEAAAQRRVLRAVEKLRGFFSKRGIILPMAVLTTAISAHSIQAAPAGLAKTVTAVAITKGAAASSSTLTLIKGALKFMAWTKTKIMIVAGVGALLAATATVKEIQLLKGYPWQRGNFNSRVMDKTPPQVTIVPSISFLFGGSGYSNNKFMGLGVELTDVLGFAYGKDSARTVYLSKAPEGKYDFIANLRSGNEEALQKEIKRKFGLVGHNETRDTDVLLLTLQRPGAPDLKPADPSRLSPHQGSSSSRSGAGYSTYRNQTLSSLAWFIESRFGKPVLDKTGLTNNFDIDLKWDEKVWQHPKLENIKKALLNQLGLELVPSREPVEMLVVEKVK